GRCGAAACQLESLSSWISPADEDGPAPAGRQRKLAQASQRSIYIIIGQFTQICWMAGYGKISLSNQDAVFDTDHVFLHAWLALGKWSRIWSGTPCGPRHGARSARCCRFIAQATGRVPETLFPDPTYPAACHPLVAQSSASPWAFSPTISAPRRPEPSDSSSSCWPCSGGGASAMISRS